tara:strand:+ start:1564 stop:2961 length:1398 start_codon:yes stop_codon:yes gene_type:complete
MFLRELFEAPGKQASFALGRLNPATTGHELLVDKIKAEPGDSFLFLTDRLPKLPKDPLTAQDKLDWARKSFDGISIGLAKTVLIAADRLYKMGYTDVTYLEGIDPEKPFPLSKLLQDYNGVKKDLHDYNFNSIRVVQLPRDASAKDAKGMSGTKMRQLVADNDLEKFKKDAVTLKAQPYAEEMFKKLQGIMGVDSVDEKLDLKDLEDDPDYQKELEKEFLKTLSPSQRKRYGKKMFDNVEEKVSTEVGAPKTIKVMKPINPPKAPDTTIPRTRDGYTKKDGTTYIQDKFEDNLMHVSDGGGTYTFDGSRMIKWQTPRIKGLKFIYDYVQNKIYMDAKNEVDIKDGTVNVDQLAAYDMKGNLIPDSGSLGIGAGGMRVSLDKDKMSIKYNMGAGLTVHATGSTNKKPSPEAQKLLKFALGKAKAGENVNFTDMLGKIDKAGAKVQFRYMGKNIPFKQGVEMLNKAS